MMIEDILSQLDPKLRKNISAASKVEIEKQVTPSIGLNNALEGGLAYGRQILIWGNKSAGKSSFCQQLIGMAQKQGKIAAWVDAEQSFDQSWATNLGVDVDNLIYSGARTVNEMVDVTTQLMSAGVDIIVVDLSLIHI